MRTVSLRSPAPATVPSQFSGMHSRSRSPMIVRCLQRRDETSAIPKLEPFSRSRIDRLVKDPPLLEKTKDDFTDYCSTLEGEESWRCWKAYFELRDLEKEMSQEDIEKLIRQSGGIKSLIDCVHGITAMQKKQEGKFAMPTVSNKETEKKIPFPVPDGIPKSKDELEEEEKARMPDSSHTRLLRAMGRFPAWYSQAPDHESD
ncbi:hypothetical protein IHE45_15G025500 [Dioscorea alata]|uniref:Uncharacterized protein n=1 Tax=Dioscorea alata TaxID=55571 RepID=A0ACB7UKE9_DIOAL|nr:hypothetical protein IHE45_15G025500 [Dioscorea alata]